jgi:hypothetical protein
LAPAGLCPIGLLKANLDGLGIWTRWLGSGCASAAAPVHGSALAAGANITHIPMAVTDAIVSDAMRWRGDISHPSRGTSR